MAYRISESEFDRFYLCNNAVGVVDVEEHHVSRIAQILSERFPGIVFIWDASRKKYTICAVKENRRKIGEAQEEKIVRAGETIARNIASKHPQPSFFHQLRRLFIGRVGRGWHFTPST
jgi:hypothetical protein